jgi:hypothetical protein
MAPNIAHESIGDGGDAKRAFVKTLETFLTGDDAAISVPPCSVHSDGRPT